MPKRKKAKKEGSDGRSPECDPTASNLSQSKAPEIPKQVEDGGTDVDRLTIAPVSSENDLSYLQRMFDMAGREVPEGLRGWENRVAAWCDEYRIEWGVASILQVDLRIAIYVFDESLERVLLAYGLSSPELEARDKNRMRRFPDINVGVREVMGADAFECDRGHFLGHAAGGQLDINLFPHRRELNQGRSQEGKLFRCMERHAARHFGTFVYHRAIYDDDTWIPDKLEYGLLVDDSEWWVETFSNKNAEA